MTPLRLRIRDLRLDKGLSQQALGELAGVRQATISALESGKAKSVAFRTLERPAKALGVDDPGELIEREPKRRAKG